MAPINDFEREPRGAYPFGANDLYQDENGQWKHLDGRPVNWAALTPEQLAAAGITGFGAEIGGTNRQSAQMSPEQRARWAMEHIEGFDEGSRNQLSRDGAYQQWLAWDKFYDPSCPPDRPYRGEWPGGGSYCLEKPVDCPPGMSKFGEECIGNDDPRRTGGTEGGGQQGGAQPASQFELGARGWGTEMDPTMLGVLADKNYQQLRSAYGLGSDAQLNQTGDMMTLANGAVMWGGKGDGAQPFIPNLGGQYSDVKQVQTPTEEWASIFMGASPYKVWGDKPASVTGAVNPWNEYNPSANADFSANPTFEIGGSPQNANLLASVFGAGPWTQQKKKLQQGGFGAQPDAGGGW